jgi:hypothetical protein
MAHDFHSQHDGPRSKLREAMDRASAPPPMPAGLSAVANAIEVKFTGKGCSQAVAQDAVPWTLNSVADELDRLYDRLDGVLVTADKIARLLDESRVEVAAPSANTSRGVRADGILNRMADRVSDLHILVGEIQSRAMSAAAAI